MICLLHLLYSLGWWKYDQRSNEEIEEAFEKKLNKIEILICGELYILDLIQNVQYPKKNSSRKRFIKRDLKCVAAKGIAGLPKY